MPRMTRASIRANKGMASNDPPSVPREGSWQFPTVSALKYSGAIIDKLLFQQQELDSEQSEEHESEEQQSDLEAGSEEDPFMASNGESAPVG